VIAIGSSLVRVGAEPISAAPAWRGGNGLLGDYRQRNTMPAHEHLAAAVQRFAGVAACVSIVVGLAVLVGWMLDVQVLKSVVVGRVSMKANTAIGFILAGVALWLLRDDGQSEWRRTAGRVLGSVVAAFAALTVAEYVFAVDLRIDHLFDDAGTLTSFPGRASPHTAVAFVAVGLWLAALPQGRRSRDWTRSALSVIACLVVLQAAIGYLYGVAYPYGITSVTGIAVHTTGIFVILCLGILAARPKQAFMGLLTSVGAGGHVARRLTPAVLLVPVLIGWLHIQAEQHGLIGTRVGLAILAGMTVVLLGATVIYTGLSLNRADAERRLLEVRLQELADRDPLTGLFNRRRFDEALKHELALAGRHGTCLTLLTIDIDGLKQTNDTYGHRAGDELILAVAQILTSELRVTDTVARLGGDEFAAVLPHVDTDGARVTAAKLVDALARSSRELDGQTLASTISAGIAVANGNAPDALTLSRTADEALYEAKASGGNGYAIAARHQDLSEP
jgi:diguanylate cyclase (GGDEF)-like protein